MEKGNIANLVDINRTIWVNAGSLTESVLFWQWECKFWLYGSVAGTTLPRHGL